MRKLILKMSMSLDGFVSDSNDRKDWIFNTGDEESSSWSVGKISEAGLIIMGRKSFEQMAPYWPTATGPFAVPMNTIPKGVFTQKGFDGIDAAQITNGALTSAADSWINAKVFNGDLTSEISKLKAESGKPIVAIGGAGFMQHLIATGLIDEFHLAIHPVALGSGLPIFNGPAMPLYLKLADVKVFPKGTVVHAYHK
ncbi:dihydrofolate reductase family protein [Pinibacter aurantiacus]|uniref:Dihydrofolate reductase family protein n=1 Tax=Pinibacter aurantiacus TaxID=2851599 RepID=A0A9E2W7Y5_9BACT|nr:dihydrofolate reductase family protein [Pinibacter aurantiacus]MBV4357481.1 dihydrofolate reductase family protein [Pinibacter aurantiacus]